MSSVRVAVGWLFGDVAESFKVIDFKKNLKLQLSAVGKHYEISALFRSILTCLYMGIKLQNFLTWILQQ